jgi:hypothetical protein
MQRRPLHMIIAKGPSLKPLYAHCLGGGTKPRITVTTHPAADGQWVWYLGGDIAEADGVAREPAEQIATAQKELAQLLPWIDLSTVQWATLRGSRRTAAIGPDPPGQRVSRRAGPPAGGLADQTGAGAGLRRPGDGAALSATAFNQARQRHSPTCQSRHGRPAGSNCCHEPTHPARLASPLGSTGLLVSLGLGTVKLGRDQGVKYPNGFRSLTTTKRACCSSRPRPGHQPDRHRSGLWPQRRTPGPAAARPAQEWVIVSKVGEEFDDGLSRHDFSAAHTRRSVERSLQRLETDFIDLVLVHSDGNDLAILNDCEVYATLAELKPRARFGSAFPAKPSTAA